MHTRTYGEAYALTDQMLDSLLGFAFADEGSSEMEYIVIMGFPVAFNFKNGVRFGIASPLGDLA